MFLLHKYNLFLLSYNDFIKPLVFYILKNIFIFIKAFTLKSLKISALAVTDI